MATYVREYELRSKQQQQRRYSWKLTCKHQNKTHLFENNHFLFVCTLNESLLGMLECLSSPLCSAISFLCRYFRSFVPNFVVSRLHLEICSRLGMSCDFMRYLFCGLVLGDKRWQDFICILVCGSSSSSPSPPSSASCAAMRCDAMYIVSGIEECYPKAMWSIERAKKK